MNELMIDIETLNTTNDAIVFQVGLAVFNSETHKVLKERIFEMDIEEQNCRGRTFSADTLAFHLGIPASLRASITDPDKVHYLVDDLYASIQLLVAEFKPKVVWAKGSFDFNILEDMFGYSNERAMPWKFYQVRELRTLMQECGVSKGDVSHNALEDCIAQIKQLKACREVIKASEIRGCLLACEQKVADLEDSNEMADNSHIEAKIPASQGGTGNG